MPGYDKSRFINLTKNESQQLVCGICLSILNNPKFTKCCEQAYCLECIEEWLSKSETCPNDRKQLTKGELCNLPKFVTNMLLSMKISCQFIELGCREVHNLEVIENHEVNCKFNPKADCPICLSQNGELSKHECITNLINKYQKGEQLNKELYIINAKYQNEVDVQRNQIDILEKDLARCKGNDNEIVFQRNRIEALKKELDECRENNKDLQSDIVYLDNEAERMRENIIKLEYISQKSNITIKILAQMLDSVQKTFSAFQNEAMLSYKTMHESFDDQVTVTMNSFKKLIIDNESDFRKPTIETNTDILFPSSSTNKHDDNENELQNIIDDTMMSFKNINFDNKIIVENFTNTTNCEILVTSCSTDGHNILENEAQNSTNEISEIDQNIRDENISELGWTTIKRSSYTGRNQEKDGLNNKKKPKTRKKRKQKFKRFY